jgi:hypothetical protein
VEVGRNCDFERHDPTFRGLKRVWESQKFRDFLRTKSETVADNMKSAIYLNVKSDVPKFNRASLTPGYFELLQIQSIGVHELQLRQSIPEQSLLDMGW